MIEIIYEPPVGLAHDAGFEKNVCLDSALLMELRMPLAIVILQARLALSLSIASRRQHLRHYPIKPQNCFVPTPHKIAAAPMRLHKMTPFSRESGVFLWVLLEIGKFIEINLHISFFFSNFAQCKEICFFK